MMKGSAVVWISGPKKEIPAIYSPVNASVLATIVIFAEKNPDWMKGFVKTLADFAQVMRSGLPM